MNKMNKMMDLYFVYMILAEKLMIGLEEVLVELLVYTLIVG